MRTFILDASEWNGPLNFYESILSALQAPIEHGRNINALIDSIFYGGINQIEPPYKLWIKNAETLPASVRVELGFLVEEVFKLGPEKGITIQIDPWPEFQTTHHGRA